MIDLISGTSATVSDNIIDRGASGNFHIAEAVTKSTITGNVAVGLKKLGGNPLYGNVYALYFYI